MNKVQQDKHKEKVDCSNTLAFKKEYTQKFNDVQCTLNIIPEALLEFNSFMFPAILILFFF
jgi:hypothetical protein